MSFSVLAALSLLPVLLSPWLMHRTFGELHALETAQIAVDNAAITLGAADRALFDELARAERRLRWLEVPHHVAHLCARDPKALPCLATDRALEAEIRAMHRAASWDAELRWRVATAAARTRLAALGVAGALERASRPPVLPRHCGACGLPIGWTVLASPVTSTVAARAPKRVTATVAVRERAGSWNYRLLADGTAP